MPTESSRRAGCVIKAYYIFVTDLGKLTARRYLIDIDDAQRIFSASLNPPQDCCTARLF
jgi:hypothetical protein